jgi:cytochrome c
LSGEYGVSIYGLVKEIRTKRKFGMVRLVGLGLVVAGCFATGAFAQDAGDAAKGARVFKKCAACHKMEAGKNGVGPSLHGVVGRAAGQVEGYNYSTAMTESGIVWTPEELAAFLAKPRARVKGTKMSFAGLKKDSEIADLIAYLQLD